jgi:aminoglycoside phosphotransferase (APT) family kinase protein
VELEEMRERLSGFIAEQGGFTSVTIENLKPMAGGASRQILSFDAVLEKDGKTVRRGMVLRRDLSGHKIETSRHDEFMVLRAAHQEGVPAPEVFWLCEDPGVLGSDFFIMERIEGESLARRLLRDQAYARARQVMPQQLAAILARIHKIDVKKHRLGFLPAPAGPRRANELRGNLPRPYARASSRLRAGVPMAAGASSRNFAPDSGSRRLSNRQHHVRPRRGARDPGLGAASSG